MKKSYIILYELISFLIIGCYFSIGLFWNSNGGIDILHMMCPIISIIFFVLNNYLLFERKYVLKKYDFIPIIMIIIVYIIFIIGIKDYDKTFNIILIYHYFGIYDILIFLPYLILNICTCTLCYKKK